MDDLGRKRFLSSCPCCCYCCYRCCCWSSSSSSVGAIYTRFALKSPMLQVHLVGKSVEMSKILLEKYFFRENYFYFRQPLLLPKPQGEIFVSFAAWEDTENWSNVPCVGGKVGEKSTRKRGTKLISCTFMAKILFKNRYGKTIGVARF